MQSKCARHLTAEELVLNLLSPSDRQNTQATGDILFVAGRANWLLLNPQTDSYSTAIDHTHPDIHA